MWQTRADDPDGWLDGGPDEHGAHQPGDVDGLGDLGEVIDAHDTGDADTVIPVSGPAGLRSRVLPNKLPSSMMPHTAAFFLFDICSLRRERNRQNDDVVEHVDDAECKKERLDVDTLPLGPAELGPVEGHWPATWSPR